MIIQFENSDKSFELLKAIVKARMAEFRDTEYESLEAFKKSEEFVSEGDGFRTERWFKARNFCDLRDLEELRKYDLIDLNFDAWHQTYIVTPFGKQILEKHEG